jgi:uncharacterized protein (TIGR03437 family)
MVSMGGVTHGATLRAGVASGAWITLFGSGLSSSTRIWGSGDIVGGRLPESLDGVSVRIDGRPASIYYISPTQINALAPEATADGAVSVTVTNNNGTSDPVSVDFRRLSPGFFQFPDENIAAVRLDGAYIGPANLLTGQSTVPARPNDVLLLFGTGFGATNPGSAPNQVVSSSLPTANAVRVQIHNQQAPVSFAGLVSAGVYQFNITVPDLPDGNYPVIAEVAGVRTAKIVKLRIQRQTLGGVVTPGMRVPIEPRDVLRHVLA